MTTVYFQVDDDATAHTVRLLVEASGFTAVRKIDPSRHGAAYLTMIADELAHRHELTPRERTVLHHVLDGLAPKVMAARMKISRHTVKWHMHNVFIKTKTDNRESLLRLALQMENSND